MKEETFTQILPAIRIQYLREWKKSILNKDDTDGDWIKRSEML